MKLMNKENKTPKELSPQQLQQRKKFVIFPLMFAGFALAMYFIFKPTATDEVQKKGLNADLPIPKTEIIGDKRTAYEQELFRNKASTTLSLEDYGIKPDTAKSEVIVESIQQGRQTSNRSSIHHSTDAYKRANRNLDNFYSQATVSSKEKELQEQLEELKAQLDSQNEPNENDELQQQLQLMEESYKMAAKYMPGVQNHSDEFAPEAKADNSLSGKSQLVAVSKLNSSPVTSALPQTRNDSLFLQNLSKGANWAFHTAGIEAKQQALKNTIQACIHSEQVIVSGQNVVLRLLEPVQAGDLIIPRYELFTGVAGVQGERLHITVSNIEYAGRILPVDIQVYDMDGQQGIFIPGSLERSTSKEILSGLGNSSGANISVNQQSAAEQLAVDMGRNIIQGGSNYLSKKLQTVKVRLKTGHQVLLLPKQD